jgi:DNA mismatch repair protein MutS2
MDTKTYAKLELDKILAWLAGYAAFSASKALVERLEPTTSLGEARQRQQETSEARTLIEEYANITIGGARDVRPYAGNAERGMSLTPEQFLEVRDTLIAAGRLKQTISKAAERFPLLAETAYNLDEGKPLIDAINRTIDDNGQVLDSASPRLAQLRRDLQVAHGRLHTKLQSIISSSQNAPYLQEALITQRGGRYVIPVKADARGRIKGIVHDQSSSGATLFIEPLATVEINNEIRELELAEQNEVLRILLELSALVGDRAEPIRRTVGALADLDAAFAKAKFAHALRASQPNLVDFDPVRVPGSVIRLYNARHPLIDPAEVVPIDVDLGEDIYILIITGPNTGGKTVSLKTVGLLTLMAQCGLHIPAAPESTLTVFDSIYADIGDEQSIEQSLSTFSAHLTHITDILEAANDRALVLLDELGSGTDPAEGAAIARAILNDMLMRGVTTFVATHYPELKLYAHSTPGVRNASVEFNVETLSPTYRLIIGLPGRSNALAIATRLGLPRPIIDEARSYVGADDLSADDLLEEIHRTRAEIRETQDRLSSAEHDAIVLRDRLQIRLDGIEQEREQIIAEARAAAQAEMDILKDEIADLRRKLRAIPPTYQAEADAAGQSLQAVASGALALEEMIDAPVRRVTEPSRHRQDVEPEELPQDGLSVGDLVFVHSLQSEGEIVSVADNGKLEVQVGQFRVRTDPDGITFRSRRESKRLRSRESGEYDRGGIKTVRPESPGLELHLRGLTLDEALPMLEDYLDQAYLSGLPWVRIVHGKGSGVLRNGVRQTLARSPLVKEYKDAPGNQGGDGVTIVHFVPLA